MSINVAQLEEYRRKHYPLCPAVPAYLSHDGMDWYVLCPYCGLHHQHSANGGGHDSVGLRSPHCPPGVDRPHDYFLIPEGDVPDEIIAKWVKIDRKQMPKLMKEIDRQRRETRLQQAPQLSTTPLRAVELNTHPRLRSRALSSRS